LPNAYSKSNTYSRNTYANTITKLNPNGDTNPNSERNPYIHTCPECDAIITGPQPLDAHASSDR
jgi:hypothetical protein